MTKFTSKTLSEIVGYIRDAVFSEEYANYSGLLQRIDTRIKFIVFLLLISSVIFARGIHTLLVFFLLSLILASLSRIPLRFYLPRVLVFIPVFTGIIAIPYIFNIFQPHDGTALIVLHEFHRTIDLPLLRPFSRIEITKEGVFWASVFLTRVTASVSFAILLMITTKWSDLVKALHTLRFPKVFVLIMSMAYRYIFLLLDLISNMLLSRKSRTVGREPAVKSWKLNAGIIGALFIKSYEMSENVYLAMLSRGFDGAVRISEDKRVDGKSYLFLSMMLCVIFLIMFGVENAAII